MRYLFLLLMLFTLPAFGQETAFEKALYDQIGGDDVLIYEASGTTSNKIAIAEDGTIFAAVCHFGYSPDFAYIMIYRSTDGGTTYSLWSQIGNESTNAHWMPDLDITKGTTPRLFLTYATRGTPNDIIVAYTDPSNDTPIWTHVPAMTTEGGFVYPDLATDNLTYDDYYLYLVAEGTHFGVEGLYQDVWFARSTDYGVTWETPYVIAESLSLPPEYPQYAYPRVCWGYGANVHVATSYVPNSSNPDDKYVKYMRATNDADSPGDWSTPVDITPGDDEFSERDPDIAASTTNNSVLISYRGNQNAPWVRISPDAGLDWSTPEQALPLDAHHALIQYHPASHEFRAVGPIYNETNGRILGYTRAGADTPLVWSTPKVFTDQLLGFPHRFDFAIDDTRGGRVAVLFEDYLPEPTAPHDVFFDAEWRGDPGYPNLEPGFPQALAANPTSPPALIDMDNDGDQEIVFGDSDDNVQILHHDGSPLAGWPVNLPGLTAGPIVVGELYPGRLSVIAGTNGGEVYSLDPLGQVESGWPFLMPDPAPTFVSMGAMGGPYPRTVVACSGINLQFINNNGVSPLGTPGWTTSSAIIEHPAAIGDIDGDGISEAVIAIQDFVVGVELYSETTDFFRSLPSPASGAPTLGNLDGVGGVEILVPTANGTLFALDGTGADLPGWPFTTPSGTPLTSAAIAQFLGNFEPEIAVAAQDWTIHTLYRSGVEQNGYPVNTGTNWYLFGAPIIGRVEGFTSDVVVPSRDEKLWAWDNFGNVIGGWPKDVSPTKLELTPAMGDIDMDGRNEIVFLGQDQIFIVDVGEAPHGALETWPMFGHDPQRTGCSDCPEDIVTAAPEDEPDLPTRVAFAGASPNPVSGSATTFRFEVPVRAQVNIELFDLRGHRVRILMRSEVSAGAHAAFWDGRDGQGNQVASGQYFARLKVYGPGVRQELTRPVTILR